MKKFLLVAIGACTAISILGCIKGTDKNRSINELIGRIAHVDNNGPEIEVIKDYGLNSKEGDKISVKLAKKLHINLESLEEGERVKINYESINETYPPTYNVENIELMDSDRINIIKDKLGV